MKRTLAMTLLVVGVLVGTSVPTQTALAQQCAVCCDEIDGCGGCDSGCCNQHDCCCAQCGLVGAVELTLVKYMQEGGVSDYDGTSANFDLELAPRFELGFMGTRGIGLRARYWDFDQHTLADDDDLVSVDTYYVDGELFHSRHLGCGTILEVCLGLRYADLQQELTGGGRQSQIQFAFDGFGGTIAFEAKHPVGIGSVYARARWSILLGNGDIEYSYGESQGAYTAHDSCSTQTELALGYEIARYLGSAVVSLRLGGEWQTWTNMALADTTFGGVGNNDVLEDCGFAGLAARLELSR
jgi:hypothetical protein